MSILVRAAAASYAANCALGTAVAARWIDTANFRWLHHGLFVSTAALTVAGIVSGSRGSRALAPALVPLAAIPYTGRRRHALTALVAAPFYAVALAKTWR